MNARPPKRPAKRARTAAAAPARRADARAPRWLETAAWLSPLAAAAVLAWSLRGAPLGVPVADDFEFLRRALLPGGGGLLDSMGASYYWRPLSRQLWFPLVGPLLLVAPGVVAAIHLALLAALAFVLARIARRWLPAPGAALVGAAVLATEPARVLVTWPSGDQHLLATLGLALAAHEVLAGRRVTAALAALAAALAHELGALAFGFVAMGGLVRRRGRSAALDVALGVALFVAWGAGYRAALAHGVQLPAGGVFGGAARWFEAARLGSWAAFDAETLPEDAGRVVLLLTNLLALGAVGLLVAASRRAALREVAWPAGLALAIGWAGLLPLASLLPDWNAWRAFVPAVALVFAFTLLATRAHLALGVALVAVRLVAMGFAAPAPAVRGNPPRTVSDLSFARLTRVQRVVAASGAVVRATRFRHTHRIFYLGLPEMTINGFRGAQAVRVWTRDTSATFRAFAREAGPDSADLVLGYDVRRGHPLAMALDPGAHALWLRAQDAADAGDYARARTLYLAARAKQVPECPSLTAKVMQNLSVFAIADGDDAAADSLNRIAVDVRGQSPESYAIDGLIAARRGRFARAREAVGRSLRLSPGNELGMTVLEEVKRLEAAAAAGSGTAR